MLIIALFQCEKIQAVRVFQDIYRKMALFCRQLGREISDGPAVLAEVISVYDVLQFTFAESLAYNACNIIECFLDGFTFRRDDQMVFPRHDSENWQHAVVF